MKRPESEALDIELGSFRQSVVHLLTVLRISFRSLRRAPVRSALTTLGVMVGVAALIATLSIGGGAKSRIQDALSKPESRVVSLYAASRRDPSGKPSSELSPNDRLQVQDYYAIQNELSGIAAASPQILLANSHVRARDRSISATVIGIDVGGFGTGGRRLLSGTIFNMQDVERDQTVCVVSESVARELMGSEIRLGSQLQINGALFTIVGIVDDISNSYLSSLNVKALHIYIPFTTLLRRFRRDSEMSIGVQARDISEVGDLENSLSDLMERRRGGRSTEFHTNNAFQSINSYAENSRTVARLIAAVGAISLVSGGIGIMNIMLVSVGERTREIGVRSAVGTRSNDILVQFLTEAIALAVLGGTVGIGVGIFTSWFVGHINGWPVRITWESVAISLLCSLVVGVLCGYQPARRASLLEPVDALRRE